jgi:hypothetical protein
VSPCAWTAASTSPIMRSIDCTSCARSRNGALELALDRTHRTARVVYQRQHSPSLAAFFEANNELLLNLDNFVG